MELPSLSFGRGAADYARGRPGYPHDAVAWLLEDVAGVVIDVGAGTGKLTEAVLRCGHHAIAVDPDPVMLAQLEAHVPGVPTHRGTAEDLPLADASAGAVVLGQAWHWVDVPAASREIARVLEPGGTLGLIWNIRDEAEPWVEALTRIIGHSSAERLLAGTGPRVAAPFGVVETEDVRWSREIGADELRALVHSRSSYLTATETCRGDVDAALERLLGSLGIVDGGTVELPYVTWCFRTRVAP